MPDNTPGAPLVQDWFDRARDDEQNLQAILKDFQGTPAGVCFLAQQMAEKYLKAYLL